MVGLIEQTWLIGAKIKKIENSKYPYIYLKIPAKGPSDVDRLAYELGYTVLYGKSNFNEEFILYNVMYEGLDSSIKQYGETVKFSDIKHIENKKHNKLIGNREFYLITGAEQCDQISVKYQNATGYGFDPKDITIEYPKEYYYWDPKSFTHNLSFRMKILADDMVKYEYIV